MPSEPKPSMPSEPLPKQEPLTDEQFSRLCRQALEHLAIEKASYPRPPETENEIRLSRLD
jgi:hypothetical protein